MTKVFSLIKIVCVVAYFTWLCSSVTAQVSDPDFIYRISVDAEEMKEGKFEPTWESLQQHELPE
ncbi:MAG TPA: alpha-L-fucosidase [Petrimonas sp.]|nr:alpha-L-fucosidase [Petrimonas sp.]